jgi:hypothetical protein
MRSLWSRAIRSQIYRCTRYKRKIGRNDRHTSVMSHEFALLYFDSFAKIESAVAVQTNGLAAEL